ncbi:STAS domain-containing protein [Streptomyces sp. NPDC016845]|uniref:STAS domain-containing protein n=1 Tax=Streptomyces sp. NPDC016845 TaxID=3364972 RepID=UPI00378F9F91
MPEASKPQRANRLMVTSHDEGEVAVAAVRGAIDYDTRPPLQEALARACTRARTPAKVVVDLSAVPFLDSGGVNTLLIAYREATGTGGWLRLAGASAAVLRVLDLVGLDSVIDVYPTVQAALA